MIDGRCRHSLEAKPATVYHTPPRERRGFEGRIRPECHLVVVVALMVLAQRRWKAVGAVVAVGVAMMGLSWMIVGAQGMLDRVSVIVIAGCFWCTYRWLIPTYTRREPDSHRPKEQAGERISAEA